jgi:YD repeat-containing protein
MITTPFVKSVCDLSSRTRTGYRLRTGAVRLILAILCLGSAGFVVAQDPVLNSVNNQTQTPIPGVGHDYQHLLGETINFSNGSVNFKISFPVPKGRGFTVPYYWTYNSGTVNPLDSVDGQIPIWDNSTIHQWPERDGWNIFGGIPLASVQVWQVAGNGIDPNTGQVRTGVTWIPCNFQSGMTFTDMGGAKHSLPTGAMAPAYLAPDGVHLYSCAGATQYTTPPAGDGQVIATLDPNTALSTSMLFSSSPTSGAFSIMDKDGLVYSFSMGANYPTSPNYEGVPMGIVDRNGNSWGYDGAGKWVDTLGRAAPTTDGSPNPTSSQTSTVTATVSSMHFISTWKLESVSYPVNSRMGPQEANLNCYNIPGTVTGNRTVLSKLQLPNGQSYQFYYGNDNPTDSSIFNPYGLLNEIIFPDGGWIKYKWAMPTGTGDSQFNEFTALGGHKEANEDGTYVPIAQDYGCDSQFQEPVLAQRQVSFGKNQLAQTQTFSYATTWQYGADGSYNGWSQKKTTVVTTDNLRGNISSQTVYTYLPSTPGQRNFPSTGAPSVASQVPLESSITYYDWGQTKALKTISKQWKDQFNLASEFTTVYTSSGSRISGTVYTYESNLCNTIMMPYNTESVNPVGTLIYLAEQDDYDLGSGKLGPLSRRTLYNYQCFQSPFPAAQPGVPAIPPEISAITIEDGNGRIVSATQYGHDASALHPVTAIDAQYGTGVTVRGNVTTMTRCLTLPASPTSACSGPNWQYVYDTSGQPYYVLDPKGRKTQFSFDDHFTDDGPPSGGTNAYLTQVLYPSTAGGQLQENFKYSYGLGYMTQSQDENSQITTYSYNTNDGCQSTPDGMYRLGKIQSPIGSTTFCYDDQNLTTTKSVDISTGLSPTWLTTITGFDGMEHEIKVQVTTDPDGTTTTGTQFDGEGNVLSISNPYRGAGPADGYIVNYYDALGRKIAAKLQDLNVQHWCFNGMSSTADPGGYQCNGQLGNVAQTSHSGAWVDFKDERGNVWQRSSNVFGDLMEVMEPNGATQTPSMETDYGYDTMHNLLSVTQFGGAYGTSGSRNRNFGYDNLSRLGRAYNPETGTITYTYDSDSNVTSKTDARGIATQYTYDARNRLTQKNYANDPTGTPTSCYLYGGTADGGPSGSFKGGRLIDAWTQTSQTCPSSVPVSYLTLRAIQSYDKMGRLTSEKQFTLGNQSSTKIYSPTYTYDDAGNLITATDGITKDQAGNILSFSYNIGGAGRVQSITSSWSSPTLPATLFSPSTQANGCPSGLSGQYSAGGALMNVELGPGLALSRSYDPRLRVNCEKDTSGNRAATPGSATVTITGSEQSK